jgi:signal peptidase II
MSMIIGGERRKIKEEQPMMRWNRLLIVILMVIASTGCDQASKAMAKQYLPENQVISMMKDTIRLHYVRNSGAFLSMGASLSAQLRTLIFTLGAGVVIFGIFIYLLSVSSIGIKSVIGLSLICGGGFGNLIDRIAYDGAVIDFLNVGIGSFRTGIFNIADMAVLAGALIVLGCRWRARRDINPRRS